MNSLEEIGALLGFVAFAGLAVLVFLTFQQARHVRRLRDWAGRAPERAAAAADREAHPEAAVSEEDRRSPTGEYPEEGTGEYVTEGGPSRWAIFREDVALRWEDLDRRSPVDPKILVGGLAAILIGVVIATGAFGLFGGSSSGTPSASSKGQPKAEKPKPVKVAVLNGTAPPGGSGVPGVADSVSRDVKDAGFKVGDVGDAGSYANSVVMYRGNAKSDAKKLASAMNGLLGDVQVLAMTSDVESLVGKADVALIVGQADSTVSG